MVTTKIQKRLLILFILCFPLVSFAEGDELPEENETTESVPQFTPRKKTEKSKRSKGKKSENKEQEELGSKVDDILKSGHGSLIGNFILGPSYKVTYAKSMKKLKKERKKRENTIKKRSKAMLKRQTKINFPKLVEDEEDIFEQLFECGKKHRKNGVSYRTRYDKEVVSGERERDNFVELRNKERDKQVKYDTCTLKIEELLKSRFPGDSEIDQKVTKMFGNVFDLAVDELGTVEERKALVKQKFKNDSESRVECTKEFMRDYGTYVALGAFTTCTYFYHGFRYGDWDPRRLARSYFIAKAARKGNIDNATREVFNAAASITDPEKLKKAIIEAKNKTNKDD